MARLVLTCGLLLLSVAAFIAEDPTTATTPAPTPPQFPDFLQNENNFWRFNARVDGQEFNVEFSGGNVTNTSLVWVDSEVDYGTSRSGQCVAMTGGDSPIYTVKWSHTDETECFSYENVTDNVVFITRYTVATGGTCDNGTRLTTPLVANAQRAGDSLSGCSLQGDFTFTTAVYESGSPEPTCPVDLPHVFESLLRTPGGGIHLQFASLTCSPHKFGLAADATLYCLEKWSQGGNDYCLLGTSYYSPQYCMVHASNDTTELYIYPGLTCVSPSDEDTEVISGTMMLNLTSLPGARYTGACNDTSTEPTSCNSSLCQLSLPNYDQICPKTCGHCREYGDPCTFPNVATWVTGDGSKVVITKDKFTAPGSDHGFTCVKAVTTMGEAYLIAPDDKDCSPAVSCVKFDKASAAVLGYKISQSMDPASDPEVVCSDNNFVDDVYPIGNKYRSRNMKNLVASNASSIHGDCGFQGQFGLSFAGDDRCKGTLSNLDESCNATDVLKMEVTCTDADNPKAGTGNHRCLGGRREYGGLVTEEKDGTNTHYICWLWKTTIIRTTAIIYRYKGLQCDQDSLDVQAEATHTECTEGTPSTDAPPDTTGTTVEPPSTPSPGAPTTGAPAPTTPDGADANSGAMSAGTVAGVVFGVLLAIVLVSVLGFYGYKYHVARRMPYRVL